MKVRKPMQMTRKIFLILGCSVSPLLLEGVEETRNAVKEWIQLENTISKESAEWKAEKTILEDQISLLEMEIDRLESLIEESKNNLGEVEGKRAEINAKREELEAGLDVLAGPLEAYEAQAKALYLSFPDPLKEEVIKLYNRIPEDPDATRMTLAERLQAIVGLLTFADKFNSGVQREVEIREIGGKQLEVETLYFGLAGAFFSDASGSYAGVGFPIDGEWQWSESTDYAKEISSIISIYAGTQEVEFQNVPVDIR